LKGLDKQSQIWYTENMRTTKDYTKYTTVVCPLCGKEHRVAVWRTLTPRFTGRCLLCNGKIEGRIVGGKSFRAEKHPRWKGGRYKNHAGYIFYTLKPAEDFFQPMTHPSSNRVMEHRLIMAKHLGRCLLPWEVVHHKNGIKDDNRLENLELLPDRRWHLIDNKTKSYIAILEQRIKELEEKK